MSATPFAFEALGTKHSRATFSCGVEALDRYLRQQATQDVRRRVAACYVAIDRQTHAIVGYYTIAAGAVLLTDVPEGVAKRLPRYPAVPVARIGRLAVGTSFQRRGVGAAMLWNAALRALRSEVAVFALFVDAKDDAAAAFYTHHGFKPLVTGSRQLFLPLSTFEAATR